MAIQVNQTQPIPPPPPLAGPLVSESLPGTDAKKKKKKKKKKLSLYLSYKLDDSYTPAALSVRAGTSPGDLQEVRAVTLDRPDGWITFDVSAEPTDDGEGL
jgi:Anaphase-promoting complex, subunit 10 (APC10)